MFGRDYTVINPDKWMKPEKTLTDPMDTYLEEEKEEGEEIKVPATEEHINRDFFGVINLIHDAEDKNYSAELILEGGCIIAASFHDKKTNDIHTREDAVKKISKKLKGTKGKLKIKHLNYRQIKKTKEKNKEKLLDTPIPFTDLDLKITMKTRPQKTTIPYLDQIAAKYGLWAVDTENPLQPTIYDATKEAIEEGEAEGGRHVVDELLAKQINGFVAQRKRRMDKFAGTPFETEIIRFIEKERGNGGDGPKVETNIDLLYKLVQEYERLRLNEILAEKLDISHTHLIRWAHILEKKGLVQVRYPFTGNPEIRKASKVPTIRMNHQQGSPA